MERERESQINASALEGVQEMLPHVGEELLVVAALRTPPLSAAEPYLSCPSRGTRSSYIEAAME